VQCTVTYDIPEATVEATWRQLAAELDEDDGPDRLLATGELDDGERAIRGSVHRQQCQLTIAANSVERLGELQQQVLAAAPGSQLVSESIVPMEELLAEGERDPQAKGDRDARPSSWASRRMRRPRCSSRSCASMSSGGWTRSSPPWAVAHRASPRRRAGAPSPDCTPCSTTSNGGRQPPVVA
jgi:hypothetical protein